MSTVQCSAYLGLVTQMPPPQSTHFFSVVLYMIPPPDLILSEVDLLHILQPY